MFCTELKLLQNKLKNKKKNQNKLKRHKLEKIVTCGTCLNSSSFMKKRRNSKIDILAKNGKKMFRLSLSFLCLEKTTEHDFSTDIFIFHLISHSSSSLRRLKNAFLSVFLITVTVYCQSVLIHIQTFFV
ncbi:hypothetical protein BpHYR1_004258 [Brachionus plicatilis]|uniref:Uncharacterized protein n=1 Tax=Brachionus plicatilis TaxID=10195 RepID=A0A3M7RTN9_BRAPC|nr:hypothetical protein BpHYR1_004258 [Brachionus plicatilis]